MLIINVCEHMLILWGKMVSLKLNIENKKSVVQVQTYRTLFAMSIAYREYLL